MFFRIIGKQNLRDLLEVQCLLADSSEVFGFLSFVRTNVPFAFFRQLVSRWERQNPDFGIKFGHRRNL